MPSLAVHWHSHPVGCAGQGRDTLSRKEVEPAISLSTMELSEPRVSAASPELA